jgi:spore maturation protein CgeB
LKITIFGLTISSSWGNGHATPYRAILGALHRMGHDVVFYERDAPYYAKRRDFTSTDFCQLVLYESWENVRSQALLDARESDVVIHASYCPEGARVIDDVFEVSTPLHVFYDLDTAVTISGLSAGDLDYVRSEQVPHFDLYLSWCGGTVLDELEQRWHARRARPLYGCVDPDVHARVDVPQQYRCLMSYMGTYAADRQQKLDSLFLEPARRRQTDIFVVAGSMYPYHAAWPTNVRHFEHVSPHDHPALYSGSRFTLNLTRDKMARVGYCPSGRLFEAAACGTPILSDWFEGLDHFFQPSEEVFVVQNTDEVLEALQFADSLVSQVAKSAQERTLTEHTGDRRATELIEHLEDVLAKRSKSIAEVA